MPLPSKEGGAVAAYVDRFAELGLVDNAVAILADRVEQIDRPERLVVPVPVSFEGGCHGC